MSAWDALQATDAALLPALVAQQIWLRVGWAVVLAWLALVAVQRVWPAARQEARKANAVVALAILWACAPGTLSLAYWLGLAFQAPSVVTVLLCLGALVRRRLAFSRQTPPGAQAGMMDRTSLALSVLAVALGWVLLLDSFALLPVSLYAWGFGPAAVGGVALPALLVVAVWPPRGGRAIWHAALVTMALLLLITLRLPTGNVWDAVLDPCAWLVLQVGLALHLWRRYKKRS
jgi:hypothetical protein